MIHNREVFGIEKKQIAPINPGKKDELHRQRAAKRARLELLNASETQAQQESEGNGDEVQ